MDNKITYLSHKANKLSAEAYYLHCNQTSQALDSEKVKLEAIQNSTFHLIESLISQYENSCDCYAWIVNIFTYIKEEAFKFFIQCTVKSSIGESARFKYDMRIKLEITKKMYNLLNAFDEGRCNYRAHMSYNSLKQQYIKYFALISQQKYKLFDTKIISSVYQRELIECIIEMIATCLKHFTNFSEYYQFLNEFETKIQFATAINTQSIKAILSVYLYEDNNQEQRKLKFNMAVSKFLKIIYQLSFSEVIFTFISMFSLISHSYSMATGVFSKSSYFPFEKKISEKLTNSLMESLSNLPSSPSSIKNTNITKEHTFFRYAFIIYEQVLSEELYCTTYICKEYVSHDMQVKLGVCSELSSMYNKIPFSSLLRYYKDQFPSDYSIFQTVIEEKILNSLEFEFQNLSQDSSLRSINICISGSDMPSEQFWGEFSSKCYNRYVSLNWSGFSSSFYKNLSTYAIKGEGAESCITTYSEKYGNCKLIGKCLALLILSRFPFYDQCFNLIGVGMGANIVYYCIKTLYKCRSATMIYNVYMILWLKKKKDKLVNKLPKYFSIVSNDVVQCYSPDDWVGYYLGMLMNGTSFSNTELTLGKEAESKIIRRVGKKVRNYNISTYSCNEYMESCIKFILNSINLVDACM
jgi:hypothetical protein